MRIFIDTNILISAALNAAGTPYKAYLKATSHPNCGVVCEQNIVELKRIFYRKFPHKLYLLNETAKGKSFLFAFILVKSQFICRCIYVIILMFFLVVLSSAECLKNSRFRRRNLTKMDLQTYPNVVELYR